MASNSSSKQVEDSGAHNSSSSLSKKGVMVFAVLVLAAAAAGAALFLAQSDEDSAKPALVGSSDSVENESAPEVLEAGSDISNAFKIIEAGGDLSEAEQGALEAVATAPDDFDTLFNAAEIMMLANNEAEAKRLYGLALDLFAGQEGLSSDAASATSFLTGAELAERAELTEQAIEYYQAAIDSAEQTDENYEGVTTAAQAGLERLQ